MAKYTVPAYPRTFKVRESRRAKAEAVQAKTLPPAEQLAKLDRLGLVAKKERAKLAKRLSLTPEQLAKLEAAKAEAEKARLAAKAAKAAAAAKAEAEKVAVSGLI